MVSSVAYDAQVSYSFVYEPTPEPSLMLVTAGLLALLVVRNVANGRNRPE
jgi:hypothetical protein